MIGDPWVRLENLTACALLKEIQFLEDCCFGEEIQLHYLRTTDGKEFDFFISKDTSPYLMLEVKWADGSMSKNFSLFDRYFEGTQKIQLVKELDREKTYPNGVEIRQAHSWLSELTFM